MRDDAPSGLSIGWQHIHSICECRNRLNYYKAINAMKWHKKKRVEMAQTSQTRTLCRIISFMEFNRRFCGAILLSSWFFSFSPKRLFRVEILLVRVLLLRGCLRHLIDECVRSGAHTHCNTSTSTCTIRTSGSILFSIRRSVFICDVHLVLFPFDGRKAFCSPSQSSSFRCLGSATLSVRINSASP